MPSQWDTILSTYGLDQIVYDPTRVTSKSVSLIDHIYTTRPEDNIYANIPIKCPSDHYPVSLSLRYGKQNKRHTRPNDHKVIRYRNFKNFNEELFLHDLKNQNFIEILQATDPNTALDMWYDKFVNTLNKHAPTICKRVKKNVQPEWHKADFTELRQQRDYCHKIKDFDNFKRNKNKLTSSIRSSKTKYFSEAIQSGKNIGELWKHLKDISSQSKSQISSINVDGQTFDNVADICEKFNDHFSSVADRIIQNPQNNASIDKLCILVNSKTSHMDTFSYTCIMPEEVLTELLKLNIHKSSGLDGIGPNILKISASVIYKSLAHIFNLSLCTGKFPLKLKLARVTPLYKSGDNTDMNNYRPISVLPNLSKLFEKFVYAQIYEYLVKYNMIHVN